jgi:hypothetical protein
MSSSVSVARADAVGGFPASATVLSDAPLPTASVAANQPICDALLAEAAKRENVYAARAYRNAAAKVATAKINLFTKSPDGVEDAWVDHHLGEKTGLFVSEFITMTHLKAAYNNGRNPYALFPSAWGGLLEDDARIHVALDVLNDLLDNPLEANRKFHASGTNSDYATAYVFYNQYEPGDTLTWFYNNIVNMVMGA